MERVSVLRIIAIIQARMSSSRLPGKVLKPILGISMLEHIVKRLQYVSAIDQTVVATSEELSDDPIYYLCRENKIACYRGSLDDVLERFYQAALLYKANTVIRITGDCPCVDPRLVANLINFYLDGGFDHAGIATGAGAVFEENRFPNGLDAECFSFAALEKAYKEASKSSDREHVTPYIWRNKDIFECGSLKPEKDYSYIRLSVDHEQDFEVITKIYEKLYEPNNEPFLMEDIIALLGKNPKLLGLNQRFIGKEGYQKLW